MSIEFNGKTIEPTPRFLVNQEDWSKELAEHMPSWKALRSPRSTGTLIDYLRDEFITTAATSPTPATSSRRCRTSGTDVIQKDVYDLFRRIRASRRPHRRPAGIAPQGRY